MSTFQIKRRIWDDLTSGLGQMPSCCEAGATSLSQVSKVCELQILLLLCSAAIKHMVSFKHMIVALKSIGPRST